MMNEKEKLDIKPLINIRNLLAETLKEIDRSELEEMGAVQAFEVGYELSWKLMQKVLRWQGKEDGKYPREIFRLAAESGLISDPKIWFEFINKRNLTVHTYDNETLEDVYSILPSFLAEINSLIKNLENFFYVTAN